MNWDAIGSIAELLSTVGVILALIYLAIQVRSSSEMNRAVVRQNLADAIRDVTTVGLEDDAFSNMVHKTGIFPNLTPEKLAPEEETRYLRWFVSVLRVYENVYLQYRTGLYEPEYWDTTAGRISGFFNASNVKHLTHMYWDRMKPGFNTGFVSEVDKYKNDLRFSALPPKTLLITSALLCGAGCSYALC